MAENVPAGLGEPVFDRLDADLAHALMSINAVKGVEIGDGFGVVNLKGSETGMKFIRPALPAITRAAFSAASAAASQSSRILP